ncbi:MAG: hypothetical protein Unbinned4162contig1001_47 [Prokaryotic dsDNA virus sp.]|nr:MAG: hypothetical protein Unbinned4162contig1001_47 [Prokaryotic dsDNA virus sp.]|tara:strand:- start:1546 stop:1848 length:303 start_codon:yes stop_codon:yes gene_type:complete
MSSSKTLEQIIVEFLRERAGEFVAATDEALLRHCFKSYTWETELRRGVGAALSRIHAEKGEYPDGRIIRKRMKMKPSSLARTHIGRNSQPVFHYKFISNS